MSGFCTLGPVVSRMMVTHGSLSLPQTIRAALLEIKLMLNQSKTKCMFIKRMYEAGNLDEEFNLRLCIAAVSDATLGWVHELCENQSRPN